MHRMKKERFEPITYQEFACRCLRLVDNSEDLYRLSVRVHATATPVQAVNVRTDDRERAGKATMCFTNPAKTAALQGTKHNGLKSWQ